ncbi:hypothetical protein IM816_08285 [Luteibacter flocculans]|uniref:Uncharacterized protein n=1 Tax=Luteibacter flocculans TaxID=2780091 RepID=A0ABY4T630_9GAMM|nr:hypothetical protein [Luteibacter flocculans]URL60066.1 hypothetical protein IM816_08285 [Luteibacter flocculans]
MNGNQPNEATARIRFAAADLAPDPDDIEDNLLRARTKGRDLMLKIPSLKDRPVVNGDTVTLVLDGEELEDTSFSIVDPDAPIPLMLSAARHDQSGRYQINYVIRYLAGGGQSETGPRDQGFVADYEPPGLPFLASPVFYFSPDDGLTPDRLDPNGNLIALVPGYTGLAIHDAITPLIDGVEGAPTIVTELPVEGSLIHVIYPGTMLSGLSGSHDFAYRIRDRAGNVSADSRPVSMNVLLGH